MSKSYLITIKLSRARVVVEIAFGRLKARWCRLSKQMDIHIDNVPYIVTACCVLHNNYVHVRCMVTLSMKNGYKTTVPTIQTSHMITITAACNSSVCSREGVATRDVLVQYLSS